MGSVLLSDYACITLHFHVFRPHWLCLRCAISCSQQQDKTNSWESVSMDFELKYSCAKKPQCSDLGSRDSEPLYIHHINEQLYRNNSQTKRTDFAQPNNY